MLSQAARANESCIGLQGESVTALASKAVKIQRRIFMVEGGSTSHSPFASPALSCRFSSGSYHGSMNVNIYRRHADRERDATLRQRRDA